MATGERTGHGAGKRFVQVLKSQERSLGFPRRKPCLGEMLGEEAGLLASGIGGKGMSGET